MDVFRTRRLVIRTPELEDAALLHALWTDPQVMTMVGFPKGLPITVDDVRAQLEREAGPDVFGRVLMVDLAEARASIGQCKLDRPDARGVAETDVKLLPAHWGQRYGVEVKRGLVDYLFEHTPCTAVQGTPNVANVASIRMQEAVGGERVGKGVFTFPDAMASYTCPVPHYVYRVRRETWERLRRGAAAAGP